MSRDNRNRPDSKSATDDWLSPRPVVDVLGPFDLDPCCVPKMPWRTARRMVSNVAARSRNTVHACGLTEIDWTGIVWVNPPYSDVLPWVERMAEHGNGFMLVPAKSTDTAWGQLLLETADAVLFQRGRFEFCLPDGSDSGGAWAPSLVAAYGRRCVKKLERAVAEGSVLRGTVGKNFTKTVVSEKLKRVG